MRVVIPSNASAARPLVDKIVTEIRAKGYNENDSFGIRLAIDEAVCNAIKHGNGCDESKKLTIEYAVDESEFTISICDEGDGFDLHSVPVPTRDENLNRPCGRGVMLMHSYMTDVQYNKRGNCVTMVKRKERTLHKKAAS